MHIISHPDKDRTLFKNLWEAILNGKTWNGEIKNKKKDGEPYWLEQKIIPTLNEDNEIENFVSIGVDITAKKQLEKLASIDKLTGLYNRRMIDEFINIEVETQKRNPYDGLSVIMVDIDYFKKVNDTHGHAAGDKVLIEVARECKEILEKEYILGRYGGEEFIAILPNTDLCTAVKFAEAIRKKIEEHPVKIDGSEELKVTLSLGVAEVKDESEELQNIFNKVDSALYAAKRKGRNRTETYFFLQ